MHATPKQRRRLRHGFLACLLWGALAVVLMPFWFGWVLWPVLRWQGVEYGSYERVGMSRCRLTEVRWGKDRTRVMAGSVEVYLPVPWLWRLWVDPDAGVAHVEVRDWVVAIEPGSAEQPARRDGVESTAEALEVLERGLRGARRWLGSASVTQGIVSAPGICVVVPELAWSTNALRGRVVGMMGGREESVSIWLRELYGMVFSEVAVEELGVRLSLCALPKGGGWQVAGEVEHSGRKAKAEAFFGSGAWLPVSGGLRLEDFMVPEGWVALPGYEQLRGDVQAVFEQGELKVQVNGRAVAVDDAGRVLPDLEVLVVVRGERDRIFVETVEAEGTGLSARLSEPMGFDWTGRLLTGPAQLLVVADLERFSPGSVKGRATGTAQIRRGTDGKAVLWVNLEAEDVGWGGQVLDHADVRGRLAWPRVDIERLELGGFDGLELEGEAAADVAAGTILSARWEVRGTNVSRFFGPGWKASGWSGSGRARGRLDELEHEGVVVVEGLEGEWLEASDARASWKGTGKRISELDAAFERGTNRLHLVARGGVEAGGAVRAEIQALEWFRGDQVLLQLEEPAQVRITGKREGSGWPIELKSFAWRGASRRLDLDGELDWPTSGRIRAAVRGLGLEDMGCFLRVPAGEGVLERLEIEAGLAGGQVTGTGEVSVRWRLGELPPLVMRGGIELGSAGAQVKGLTVAAEGGRGLRLDGGVPVRVLAGPGGFGLGRVEGGVFELRGEAPEPGPLWEVLAERTGIRCEQPQLRLEVRGEAEAPQVELVGRLKSLEWVPGKAQAWPKLEGVELRARVEGEWLHVEECRALVEGQAVQLAASIPFRYEEGGEGRGWRLEPEAEQVMGQVLAQDVELAAFRRYLPAVLAPRGRLSLRLQCQPGLVGSGWVELREAATEPLSGLLPVRDLEVRLLVEGRGVMLERGQGWMGGERLELSGRAGLPPGGAPWYQLTLVGTNVPVLRQADLVVRSDLSLSLSSTGGVAPLVRGRLRLRDSTVTKDLRMLLPSAGPSPALDVTGMRVASGPFASWEADVAVVGDDALRVQTPVFRGVASVDLRVRGRLRDPQIYGEVRVNRGRVVFPFGDLEVTYGTATVEPDRPGDVDLELEAESRVYGYQVKLTVGGTAAEPQILLDSTPPMSSQEILLLLTAGQFPRHEQEFTATDKVGRLGMALGKDVLRQLGIVGGGADRLELRSGSDVSSEGRPTYEVEYRLGDRWSAYGEYDRFGGINGGVKYRVYSR